MGKTRDQLKKIIFGTETFGGRLFDLLLIVAIIFFESNVMGSGRSSSKASQKYS